MITSPPAPAHSGGADKNRFRRRHGVGGLDEEYERMMHEARERARGGGRGDVLEYLDLKAANDAARSAPSSGCSNLHGGRGELNRAGAG